ncbi:IclR family transcriptional regulator C-terminal domain-containing protein [Streptomyces sp. NPDC047860]|uniref:IclR family transcriptional regulator domain-containing protein n=1 Tax=Streptomyces sp. NPDC047860 TaxID=3155743 RepID=UPI003411F047
MRAEGFAYEGEESNAGITCAAGAVLRADGSPTAAISVTGAAGQLDMRQVASAVKIAALGLNRRIRASSAFSSL